MEVDSSVQVNYETASAIRGRTPDCCRWALLFLNRYIEVIGPFSNRTPQDAVVHLAIDWLGKHLKCILNQVQLITLVGIKTTQPRSCGLSEPTNAQEYPKFGVNGNRNKYFRLTVHSMPALERDTFN